MNKSTESSNQALLFIHFIVDFRPPRNAKKNTWCENDLKQLHTLKLVGRIISRIKHVLVIASDYLLVVKQ